MRYNDIQFKIDVAAVREVMQQHGCSYIFSDLQGYRCRFRNRSLGLQLDYYVVPATLIILNLSDERSVVRNLKIETLDKFLTGLSFYT